MLQRLSGAINAIPADINGDGVPDIVALISQEWEEIWAFVNDGRGRFTPRMIWGSTNPDFGSSWMTMVDLDRDGDPDILYANGDAFEYAPPNSRPWQGIQWLENRGDLKFEFHRMVDLQGATSPEAVDLDGDGDLDVLLVTANNDWDNPAAPSLLWLENDGKMQFTMHADRQRADASADRGRWRSRWRRQARRGDRRDAHQPAVRSHRSHYGVVSQQSTVGRTGLLESQRNRRTHPRGTPRGHAARDHRDHYQQDGHDAVCDGVERRDAEQQRHERAARDGGSGQADRDAQSGQRHPLAKHEREDVGPRRAERRRARQSRACVR